MGIVIDVLRIARQRDPTAFEYADVLPTTKAEYREAIDAGLVLGDPDAAGLVPLARDRSGGYFLRWPAGPIAECIVYLGSEGQTYVAARSETELASMLPSAAVMDDAMRYWYTQLTAPDEAPALLASAVAAPEAAGPRCAWSAALAATLEASAIAIERDPFARIGEANRVVLREWIALRERRFGPVQRAARPYRASEAFAVGERVVHPTLGEGVVEASLEAGKIAVTFASGRKVLVHGRR